MQWISVNELPTQEGEVLTLSKNGDALVYQIEYFNLYERGDWYDSPYEERLYWTYLPEPPEMEAARL